MPHNRYDELWEKLKRSWSDKHAHPATLVELEAFEAKFQVKLPDDFKSYLLNVNGIADDWDTDDEWICFWSLKRITTWGEACREFNQEVMPEADKILIFADHLIRSHDFAIHLSSDPQALTPIYIMYGGPLKSVARNFSEFIERYIERDPEVIVS